MSEDDLFNKTVKSELSFKPVINKTPKYLTIEQIDFYNKIAPKSFNPLNGSPS